MNLIDIMRSTQPKPIRAYESDTSSSIDWQELIISLRQKTKLSYAKLSDEIGIKDELLRHIGSGKCAVSYQPKFDNGIALLVYAREIGADLTRAINQNYQAAK